MSRSVRVFLCALVALACVAAFAAVVPQQGRFEALVVQDPSSRLGIVAEAPDSLPGFDAGRAGWNAFRAGHGADWNVWLDRRSGAPTLVQGPGIRWFASGESIAADVLEGKARQFLTA